MNTNEKKPKTLWICTLEILVLKSLISFLYVYKKFIMYTHLQTRRLDTHDTEFSIALIKSTSTTKMGGIISTDEDHNIFSEAQDDLGDDCNSIRINFTVEWRSSAETSMTGTLEGKHKVMLTGNKTPEKKKSHQKSRGWIWTTSKVHAFVKHGRKEL